MKVQSALSGADGEGDGFKAKMLLIAYYSLIILKLLFIILL